MVSEKKMFENVKRRRTTDAQVIGILIAHSGAFGSGGLERLFRAKESILLLIQNDFKKFNNTGALVQQY